jgi:heme/copper-type cytochrome/quinol oxidase subunit 2
MSTGLVSLIIVGGAIGYIAAGMFAYHAMTVWWGARDTEGCSILALLWPMTLAFWLLVGWPMLFIMWSYKKMARRANRKIRTAIVK